MNEFFSLAAKIASDNKKKASNYGLNVKVASGTWDKIKDAAGKAWSKTKEVAGKEHVKKGLASAAIGGATYAGGRLGGLSKGKAAGAGIGAAAVAEGAQYAPAGYNKAKDLIARFKAKHSKNRPGVSPEALSGKKEGTPNSGPDEAATKAYEAVTKKDPNDIMNDENANWNKNK